MDLDDPNKKTPPESLALRLAVIWSPSPDQSELSAHILPIPSLIDTIESLEKMMPSLFALPDLI